VVGLRILNRCENSGLVVSCDDARAHIKAATVDSHGHAVSVNGARLVLFYDVEDGVNSALLHRLTTFAIAGA
jgi:hypothetical protein